MKRKFYQFGISLLLFFGLLTGGTQAVTAAGAVVITGEGAPSLSAITVGDFSGVTLDGTTQTTTLALPSFTVTDATGTGAGWNVNLSATQFSEADPGTKTLSTGSLTLTTAPDVALADTESSPTNTVTVADAGPSATIDEGSGIKLLSAAVNGGMGSYTIGGTTPAVLTLTLKPKEVYETTYNSTLTFTVSTGP
ncbi:WxL domain-containing protein [Halobacillus yeomjeoni]|uniref:WxL domain-containing protein n=1 Tax=Halobacillus yeomjeoni TaxID=311194 RepID=A0A931HWV0_9BACI|nr:WxL domain-containing protein [Halobacillus yeomjeoni]MBH0231332.1 WxL domain-containing protein [Halobacillus yeomjeoni]